MRSSRPSSLLKAHRAQISHSLGGLGWLGLPLCANQRGEALAGGRKEEWRFISGFDFKESLWSKLVLIEKWESHPLAPRAQDYSTVFLRGGGAGNLHFPKGPHPHSPWVFLPYQGVPQQLFPWFPKCDPNVSSCT